MKAEFPRWLGSSILALGLAVLLERFWRLDLAPFIQDEPSFLMLGREQLLTGHWADHSPLQGVSAIRYGPSGIWFYGVEQALFGSNPLVAIGVVCAALTLAQLAFAQRWVRGLAGREAPLSVRGLWLNGRAQAALGVLLALLGAAPYEHFWSRLAWDPLTNLTPYATLAVLMAARLNWARGLAAGALMGLGFSSHPMLVLFCGAVGAVLLVEHWREPRQAAQLLGPLALAFAVVNLPFLLYLKSQPIGQALAAPAASGLNLGDRFGELLRPASFWKISYFFDAEWPEFHPGIAWDALGKSLTILAGVAACGGWGWLALRGRRDLRRVAAIALLCLVGYPLFYARQALAPHPHYQFPVCWLVPGGLAVLAVQAFVLARRWAPLMLVPLVVLASANEAFVVSWREWIDARSGTRGIHYGTPISLQREAVRTLCFAGQRLLLENHTALFEPSVRQHLSSLPECQSVQAAWCGAWCPPPGPGVAKVTIGYAEATGGRLRWQRGDGLTGP